MHTNEKRTCVIPAGPNCMAAEQDCCEFTAEDQWDCDREYSCSLINWIDNTIMNEHSDTYLGIGKHTKDNSKWWLPKCSRCEELFPGGGTYTVTFTVEIDKKEE